METQRSQIPAIGEGKRGVHGHIGYLLRQAYAAHRMQMEKALAAEAVTLPQFSALTMIAAYPGASGAELARLSLLTPQTMSVIVNNLEKAGWISRLPHAQHGRIQNIDLTDSGQEVLARCKAIVKSIEDTLLADIAPDDEMVIRRWLVAMAKGDSDDPGEAHAG